MNPDRETPWQGSLQWRLLAITLVGMALALVLAGVLLHRLFHEHVQRQFQAELEIQLEQLTARLEFDAQGQPVVDTARLSDPRWTKPLSGRYWQVTAYPHTADPAPSLRSRSLWDEVLHLPPDVVADGAVHRHALNGPGGQPVVAFERTVRAPGAEASRWTLVVAADASETEAATTRFARALVGSLAVLLAALGLAAVAQVWVGLSPLRALRKAVATLEHGQASRVLGQFPAEVQPLVDGFNRTLERQEQGLARARTQAGNLAHALKTPLAVLRHAADQAQTAAATPAQHTLAHQVHEQVDKAQQHIDWHLRRARSAARAGAPQRPVCALLPTLRGLQRVMEKVHSQRQLQITLDSDVADPQVAIEQEDLHELLGNLVDNACKWAHSRVHIHIDRAGDVTVDDDGPGVPADQRAQMLQRGERLDETTPGSGLGLAIVVELAELYDAQLQLAQSPWGGLSARLTGLTRNHGGC